MIGEDEMLLLLERAIHVLEQSIQDGKKKMSRDEAYCFRKLHELCSAKHTWKSDEAEEQALIYGVFGLAHFLVTRRLPGDRSKLTQALRIFRRKRFSGRVLMQYLLDVFRLMKKDVEQSGLEF